MITAAAVPLTGSTTGIIAVAGAAGGIVGLGLLLHTACKRRRDPPLIPSEIVRYKK